MFLPDGYNTHVIDENPSKEPESGISKIFRCNVTRRGEPINILGKSWYRNGVELDISISASAKYSQIDDYKLRVKIRDLDKTDTGKYTCVIHNGISTGLHQALELIVKCISFIIS